MPPTFHMRPASIGARDDHFILACVDSQLPYLTKLGSEEQWGSRPQSGDEEKLAQYRAKVEASEATARGNSWNRASTKVLIAEIDVPGTEQTPTQSGPAQDCLFSKGTQARFAVAAMILNGKSAEYTRSVISEQDESDEFLWIGLVVTERSRPYCRGAGTALLEYAKEEARALGVRRLCLDCWNGNDRKLVQ